MANTKKTTTKTEETKETSVTEELDKVEKNDSATDENERLKNELAELRAQMKIMAEMMAVPKVEEPVQNSDELITFVNLTNGTLVLKGAGNAIKKIEGLFGTRSFTRREAQIIVGNMPNLVHSGMVYIDNAQFVKENDLADSYANFLTAKQMKELFDKDPFYAIEAYKSTTESQQRIIVDIICEKRSKGEFVDANILTEIGKLSGKDLVGIEPEE